MQKFKEKTEHGKALKDAYSIVRELACSHKKAEKELSKNSMNMTMQQVHDAKHKISNIRKDLDKEINKFTGIGGVWDNEKERNDILI